MLLLLDQTRASSAMLILIGRYSVSSSAFYHFIDGKTKMASLISRIFRRNDILLKILEKLEKIQSNKKIDWLLEEKKTRSKSMKTGK